MVTVFFEDIVKLSCFPIFNVQVVGHSAKGDHGNCGVYYQ